MSIDQEKMIVEALPSLYPLQKFEEDAIHAVLNSLSTIQPEIVRCKDCKHWKDSDGVFRRGIGVESKCPLNLHQVYEGTFFCGLAERI